jgi:succinylglutamic semialdehyde dehydrogenase
MSQPFERISPVTGEVTWTGTASSENQIDQAMESAHRAFRSWRLIAPSVRLACLRRYAAYLEQHRESIATTITLETGKPLWESRLEVGTSIAKVDLAAQAFHERRDSKLRSAALDSQSKEGSEIAFRPIGSVLVLGPFNLPLHLPGAHFVPALLAGNTVVFKSSEKTPQVGQCIAKAMSAAGLPSGVFQLLQGGAPVAAHAMSNPSLGGVFFTGSRNAGLAIHRQMAGRPEVLVALEMGGNNPLVVDGVADVEAAIEIILQSAYITGGQRCSCARRLILVDTLENRELVRQLAGCLPKMRLGHPMADPGPFYGTMIDLPSLHRVLEKQSEYLQRGMHAICAAQVQTGMPTQLTPGLLDSREVETDDEEVFGPLLVLRWVSNLEDAIQQAARTRYGLSASLLSDDPNAWTQFRQEIDAGVIHWNHPTTGATGVLPFGGLGWSGNHRSSGYFASDYCSDPTATLFRNSVAKASKLPTGLETIWEQS